MEDIAGRLMVPEVNMSTLGGDRRSSREDDDVGSCMSLCGDLEGFRKYRQSTFTIVSSAIRYRRGGARVAENCRRGPCAECDDCPTLSVEHQ